VTHTFRAAVENGDAASLSAALTPDVVFHSPAVFTPYVGRDAVMQVLGAVVRVFEDFHYVSEITTGDEQVLRFAAVPPRDAGV
jgi:ketosteroid isomerase-like protein